MPLQRRQGPAQVAAEECLGRLEEIALGHVGRQLRHVRLLDHRPVTGKGGELVDLLDEQPGVGSDAGHEQAHRRGADGGAGRLGFAQDHALEGGLIVVTDQNVLRVLLAPLRERPAAVHRRRSHEYHRLGGVHGGEQFLEVTDQLERALSPAGDRIGEEIDVLEPDDAPAAEHGDGLQAFAEPVDGRFDLSPVVRKAADRLPRELVGHLRRQRGEAFAPQPVDQVVVGTADERERLGGHA